MLCFSDSSLWLQTPWLWDRVSIRARFGVPLLLFMGYRLPDRKDGVHSPVLWVHSVIRHPSTERRPGKVCTGPKNTPAASSSANCHLKVTTGQFATWTTCYLCSLFFVFFLDGQLPSTCCCQNTKPNTTELSRYLTCCLSIMQTCWPRVCSGLFVLVTSLVLYIPLWM